jgi:eukaryotic-like serine/threonine-protein kinase
MTLPAGARLGPYEIVALVGAGGMGEVYKARDTRLSRTVAIKLLPADMADRPDRRARFEVEARAISALSHPNICTLFDVGDEGGRSYFVMEFLEGETLDDRLARGPLAPDEVVRFAAQIADALAHAHRARIVHRDLKPGNVMLTASGAGSTGSPQVKLLDFGLALRPIADSNGDALSTVSFDQRKLTAEGTILGTFQYMAPEQLEGRDADARTDIFAFGALLYEMASGRKPFEGASQATLIASILTAQPAPVSSVRGDSGLPPAFDHLVERCLAKQPDDRWQTARDVKLELDWIMSGGSRDLRPAAPLRSRRRGVVWTAAAAIVAAAVVAGLAAFGRLGGAADLEVTRFTITPPEGTVINASENRTRLALSPDGRKIAFVGQTNGRLQIWVRSLDSLDAKVVPGTDDATSPFWSPDSKYLGYFAPDRGELRKVAIEGGPARTICSALVEGLPEWGADGTILLSVFREGIFRVSAEGGTPARITTLDAARREINHYWPTFLPDGRHFLFVVTANDTELSKAPPALYVATLDGAAKTLLPRIHSRTLYSGGRLLFIEEGALLAQPFDLNSLRASGEAVRVADGVATFRAVGNGSFSVSNNGTLAFLGSGDTYQTVWYDRQGHLTETGWPKLNYGSLRLSPDGRQAVVDVYDPRYGESDLWIYDLVRNVPRRFTSDAPSDRNAVWSPDARRMLYTAERGGSPNLFTKPVEGGGTIEPVVRDPGPIFTEDWSLDGRWILYTKNTRQTSLDVWLQPLEPGAKPRPFAATRFNEVSARFSPDGRWVAFVSDEANETPEVYVAPLDQPDKRRQISIGGGAAPRWRRDGKELLYSSTDGRSILSVAIRSLDTFDVSKPLPVVSFGPIPAALDRLRGPVYDVTPDGQRFLVSFPHGDRMSSRITVALNWQATLGR